MRQKRKQELQTNELAQMLLDIREFFARYGNYVMGGVVVLAIAGGLFLYIRRAEATARDNAYQQLRTAQFFGSDGSFLSAPEIDKAVDSLRLIAKESKDPTLTQRALLQLASGVLRVCVAEPLSMNETRLQAAEDACKRLLNEYGTRPVVAGSALLNLAAIEGNRFVLDGDMNHKDKARAYLTEIPSDKNRLFAGTPFMRRALDAINKLDTTFQTVTLAAGPAPAEAESPVSFRLRPGDVRPGAPDEPRAPTEAAPPVEPPSPAKPKAGVKPVGEIE